MPGSRYREVRSRFKEPRTLPAACVSWIDGGGVCTDDSDAASSQTSAPPRAGVGDLPENKTEFRLYRSRLLDLAIERQKAIQESDYTRNQFIDHQMRKSKTLDRLLTNFDIEQYRNKSTSVVEKLHQKSVHARLMILATKRLGLTIDETRKFTEEELRQKLNIGTEEPDSERAEPDALNQPARPVTTRTQPLSPGGLDHARRPSTVAQLQTRRGTGLQLPRLGSVRLQSGRQSIFNDSRSFGSSLAPTPVERRPRTGSARRRVQSDRRCTELIQVLTPRYCLAGKTDVESIIRSNPSLSLGSERSEHSRQHKQAPKTKRQAMEILDSLARRRYYEPGNLATLS